jgi:thiamine phosphate synthase YjbQ (UPF0047 family)
VRTAVTASAVRVPLADGELVLGEHQSIFLCEFDGPRTRSVHITVV